MAKYKIKAKDIQIIVKVTLSFKEKINVDQLNFFSNNCNLRGFLKPAIKKSRLIEYSGPIAVSLQQRLQEPVSKYEFLFIMEEVVDMVRKLELNYLPKENVVLDIKNVFINETTKELQFIYLPLKGRQQEADIIGFMEQIMYTCKPLQENDKEQQENDKEYVSRFNYFIAGIGKFDVALIEKYIQQEDRDIVNIITQRNKGTSGFLTDDRKKYYEHLREEEKTIMDDDEEMDRVLNDEATGLLEDEKTGKLDNDATGLLKEDATGLLKKTFAVLYRCSTKESIKIDKSVFRIGKQGSDYVVSDNASVSRSHADIIVKGEKFYISDLNSKNGTYVNGRQIPVQQEIEIYYGNTIRLANEEFELKRSDR